MWEMDDQSVYIYLAKHLLWAESLGTHFVSTIGVKFMQRSVDWGAGTASDELLQFMYDGSKTDCGDASHVQLLFSANIASPMGRTSIQTKLMPSSQFRKWKLSLRWTYSKDIPIAANKVATRPISQESSPPRTRRRALRQTHGRASRLSASQR